MLKAVSRAVVAAVLVISYVWLPEGAMAQVAPTNSATITGSLLNSAGQAVSGAKITLTGPRNAVTQTDSHGLFVIVGVPFGDYTISAESGTLGTATRTLTVTGDTDVAIEYNAGSVNGLKTIANVSTNAKFNVTPASVTQVNPAAAAFQGQTSWRAILEQIPGVAQAGLQNGNSFFSMVTDSPMVPMEPSIDGALPYETASSLDGMPLTSANNQNSGTTESGAGFNLAVFPLNGFSSADVVRGPGVNAPSIVDSIGGSFVLHSPGAITQNSFQLSASTTPYGGIVTNALVALHAGKLSGILTYGVNNSPGPIESSQFQSLVFATTINGQSLKPYVPPCTTSNCQFGNSYFDPRFGNYSGFYGDQAGLVLGGINTSTGWNQHSGSLALNYSFSPKISVGIFYVGQNAIAGSPTGSITFGFFPPSGYTGKLQPGTFGVPYCYAVFNTYAFLQGSSLLEEKANIQIGRGVLRLGAVQNRTYFTFNLPNRTTAELPVYGAGYLNGSSSLTYFNGGMYSLQIPNFIDQYSGGTDNRDLLFSYELPLGDRFHAGASYVESYYNAPFTFYYQQGPVIFYDHTGIPSSVSQSTDEMRVFVGGNLSDKTSIDLSGYFANAGYHVPDPGTYLGPFSGVSPTTYVNTPRLTYAAPRLGFVWRPTPSVSIRASAGGGFALAPIQDLVGSSQSCLSTAIECSVSLNNLNLQPEKSFAFVLGTDVRLPHSTIVSFDVYHTNLFGQLYNATSFAGNGTCPGNTVAPCYKTQYGNLGESRYEGLLLDVHHDIPQGIFWQASGGLTRGYVVSVPGNFYNAAGCTLCANLSVVKNVNFNGTFTGVSVPYSQGLATIGYRWSPQKYVSLVTSYFGNNNTYFRPAFVEFNGNIGFPVAKNASLLMTFLNITGIYDASIQTYSPGILYGNPTVAGLPIAEYGENYGPRTVELTLQIHG